MFHCTLFKGVRLRFVLLCSVSMYFAFLAQNQTKQRPFLAADVDPRGRSASSSFSGQPKLHQKAQQAAIRLVHRSLDPFTWAAFDPGFSSIDSGLQVRTPPPKAVLYGTVHCSIVQYSAV